jgi:cell division protein FtsL
MAEYGLSKLIGSALFSFFLLLSMLTSMEEPLNDPAFKAFTESLMVKYKVQIGMFVISAIAIAVNVAKQWVKRDLMVIQLELEKEKLRTEKLNNDLKELDIEQKKSAPK